MVVFQRLLSFNNVATGLTTILRSLGAKTSNDFCISTATTDNSMIVLMYCAPKWFAVFKFACLGFACFPNFEIEFLQHVLLFVFAC
jgi:hypothetical protein